jgi:hypothetical protein
MAPDEKAEARMDSGGVTFEANTGTALGADHWIYP